MIIYLRVDDVGGNDEAGGGGGEAGGTGHMPQLPDAGHSQLTIKYYTMPYSVEYYTSCYDGYC